MTLRYACALALLLALLPTATAQGTTDVFVGNQGTPASLTVVDSDLGAAETLFSGQFGGFIQGMARMNDRLYVTGNGSRIDVIDMGTRARIAQITDAAFPTARYIAQATPTKAYVTTQNYAAGATTSEVVVVDLTTNTVSGRVTVPTQPEGIAVAGGRAYLSVAAFGASTNLVAIDVATDAVVQTIDIGCEARILLADADGEIWAFCNGDAGVAEAVVLTGATGAEVARLTFDRALGSAFGLGQDASLIEIDPDRRMVAIVAGGARFIETRSNELGLFVPLAAETASAIGVDGSNRIFAAYPDAAGPFSANGTVVAYDDVTGAELASFTAGVFPTYIVVDDVVLVADEAGPTVGALALSTPSPNPTRGAARLTARLASAMDVDAGLYDALGRRVATLAQGAQPAGDLDLMVDTAALPAGVYLVRLRADGAVATARLSVVR